MRYVFKIEAEPKNQAPARPWDEGIEWGDTHPGDLQLPMSDNQGRVRVFATRPENEGHWAVAETGPGQEVPEGHEIKLGWMTREDFNALSEFVGW